jgi:hypothetical protein
LFDFFIGLYKISFDPSLSISWSYIIHVRMNIVFATCEDIESLYVKMVQTGKHVVFTLVYKLIELALLLPVSTQMLREHFWQ